MKNGLVIIIDRYDRAMILANQQALFVFGDNLERVGYGGQAAEARDCPNAVGIPTKISPSEYIFDDQVEEDRDRFRIPIEKAFGKLVAHLDEGGTVVWPKDGVGTGLARLDVTAPKLFSLIEQAKERMFSRAEKVMQTTQDEVNNQGK